MTITLAEKFAALEALGYDCSTSNGEITAWRDPRPQPGSWEEIMELASNAQPRVPEVVTPRQFRLAVVAAGIALGDIESALAGNAAALVEWEYASEFRRDHPMISQLAAGFGLGAAELDALFIAAGNL